MRARVPFSPRLSGHEGSLRVGCVSPCHADEARPLSHPLVAAREGTSLRNEEGGSTARPAQRRAAGGRAPAILASARGGLVSVAFFQNSFKISGQAWESVCASKPRRATSGGHILA